MGALERRGLGACGPSFAPFRQASHALPAARDVRAARKARDRRSSCKTLHDSCHRPWQKEAGTSYALVQCRRWSAGFCSRKSEALPCNILLYLVYSSWRMAHFRDRWDRAVTNVAFCCMVRQILQIRGQMAPHARARSLTEPPYRRSVGTPVISGGRQVPVLNFPASRARPPLNLAIQTELLHAYLGTGNLAILCSCVSDSFSRKRCYECYLLWLPISLLP